MVNRRGMKTVISQQKGKCGRKQTKIIAIINKQKKISSRPDRQTRKRKQGNT